MPDEEYYEEEEIEDDEERMGEPDRDEDEDLLKKFTGFSIR